MAVQADDSLLFPGQNEEDEDEALYERILLQATQKIINARSPMPDSKQIRPQPGFCIKTRSPQGKVFINVCRSPSIPPPADLTEQELLCVIEDDQTAFRVPMSLGEPHAELDKSGQGCTAYDVAINSDFYEKLRTNDFFLEFFVTVALEGLSSKVAPPETSALPRLHLGAKHPDPQPAGDPGAGKPRSSGSDPVAGAAPSHEGRDRSAQTGLRSLPDPEPGRGSARVGRRRLPLPARRVRAS
ncbi:PIH1 domain-containing protein 1 isoform X2 [Tachyglossus aculeatus]|uniref:PIH1 domain-containing protein 1 isoform X2 n=1 Tax=Tachyglossus aculeatus TaxID=9261 RepID=UPI0018F45A67|nr:PIH1 domain-containing protein 1 isoform X2 [Tachyglossus aculeatus]